MQMNEVIFRTCQAEDAQAIESLFTAVFTESDSETEGLLVGRLARELIEGTNESDLSGYVGEREGALVASLFFTRLTFSSDVSASLLAPVAVHTAHQGKGIGQGLILHGIDELRKEGVKFVITYGDPSFYGKVGFQKISPEVVVPPFALTQPEGWLGRPLQDEAMESLIGECCCVSAFNNPAYW